MRAPKQKDRKFRLTINEFFRDVFEAVEDNNSNTNKNKINNKKPCLNFRLK